MQISLSEAKDLVAKWSKGTFPSVAESIKYHFLRHGKQVGAVSIWQYLRKAEAFARGSRWQKRIILDDGSTVSLKRVIM